MDDERRLQLAQWTLERQLSWITAADAKAGFLVGMYLAIAAVAAALLQGEHLADVEKVLMCLAFLLSLPSLVFTVVVFFPQTSGPAASMFYFCGIVERGAEKYGDDLANLSTSNALRDLAAQIVRNAEIAKRKHDAVAHSIRLAAMAVLAWLVVLATVAALS